MTEDDDGSDEVLKAEEEDAEPELWLAEPLVDERPAELLAAEAEDVVETDTEVGLGLDIAEL